MVQTLLTILALTLTTSALAQRKVVYGSDNRQDVYQVQNSLYRKLALSTAGMVHQNAFVQGQKKHLKDISYAQTLETAMNVCSHEKFSQQKLVASCSGFLIGEDTLITAGHCYQGFDNPYNICNDYKWVFGFEMKSANHDPTVNIKNSDIYGCKEVLSVKLDAQYDFAIIRLDRKVKDRPILKFRESGKVADNTPLVVIGHPTGLPTKIADGAFVTRNDESTRFSASLDTFQGNSGSAVFNAQTGVVEGILVMGKTDYVPSNPADPNSCLVANKCDQFARNCTQRYDGQVVEAGEVVIRTTAIIKEIERALRK